MSDYKDLLDEARTHYGVPALSSIDALTSWLREIGAVPLDVRRHEADLTDEFVDPSLIVAGFTLTDGALLRRRATDEERENYVVDVDEVFDANEYGPENAEWTTLSHEVETLQRLLIIIERSLDSDTEPGNFRIYGAGQWLRESLWAATGVVPRDPGAPSPESTLFGQAFAYVGRQEFAAEPIEA